MEHVTASEASNSTDCASVSGKETALFFFVGLVTIWTSIILLSVCVARCNYSSFQVNEENQQNLEEVEENIITKRAVSLPKTREAAEDVETGCNANNEDTPECPICMNSFEENDIVSWSQNRNCRHAFHHACILPWLLKDRQCPVCRQPFWGISSDRGGSSFFSVQLGVVDVENATPEQLQFCQGCLVSSERKSHEMQPNKQLDTDRTIASTQ